MMRISSLRKPEMQLEIFSWDVEISSSNSKFPVGQSGNFQLDKVEISSSNSKFPVGMSKFPVGMSKFPVGMSKFPV